MKPLDEERKSNVMQKVTQSIIATTLGFLNQGQSPPGSIEPLAFPLYQNLCKTLHHLVQPEKACQLF